MLFLTYVIFCPLNTLIERLFELQYPPVPAFRECYCDDGVPSMYSCLGYHLEDMSVEMVATLSPQEGV